MKTRLIKGLNKQEAMEVKENFTSSFRFRERLSKVLEEEIEGLHTAMRDESAFDKPSWAYYQADKVARVKALKTVISLLNEK